MINLASNGIDIKIRDVLYKTEATVLSFYQQKNRHSNSIVFYIHGGHKHRMENSEEFTTVPHDLLYLPYNSNYVSRVLEPGIEYYQVNFEIYENGRQIPLLDGHRLLHSPDSSEFLPHLLEVYNLYTVRPHAYTITALGHILTMISMLVKKGHEEYSKSAARRRIGAAVDYIDAKYFENTDVCALAELSGMSVSGLEKNFIKAFDKTPISYRNSIRIEHAKTLFLGGFSISEVWERIGFSDLYYFAKCFKKHTGMTPGRFLKERAGATTRPDYALSLIKQTVSSTNAEFTKSEIAKLCPSLSASVIESSLKKLVHSGDIIKHGAGRFTYYTKKG